MNGGAVVYLAQSNYGRAGTKVTINDYYTSTASPYRTTITGLVSSDSSDTATTNLSKVSSYYTEAGFQGNTTGNITGVYDLNGGLNDATAAYMSNGDAQLTSRGNGGSSGDLMGAPSTASVNGYQSLSTRNYTVYSYNSSNDDGYTNYAKYKNLFSASYGYGDAILEVSKEGEGATSWNLNSSNFTRVGLGFFYYGGSYNDSSKAGIFSFWDSRGIAYYNKGFRAVLIVE